MSHCLCKVVYAFPSSLFFWGGEFSFSCEHLVIEHVCTKQRKMIKYNSSSSLKEKKNHNNDIYKICYFYKTKKKVETVSKTNIWYF